MSAKSEQKTRSHAAILESAARLLRERGIAGARVAEVMRGAGLTVGGFYAHFDSKESLIDATLRAGAAAVRERLFARLEEKPEGERVEAILKRYLSAAHRDERDGGCPLPVVAGEIGTRERAHEAAFASGLEAHTASLEALLPSAGPLPRRALALALLALMIGGLSVSRAVAGTALSEEVLRACRSLGALAVRRVPRA